MKWFKHQSDSHTNLKIKELIRQHGLTGYGFFFLILEFLAKNSENFRIKHEKVWKKELQELSRLNQKKLDQLLETLTGLDLICKRSLKKGVLYAPKIKEYVDEYTRKTPNNVRRYSRQTPDNVAEDTDTDKDKDKEIDKDTDKIKSSVSNFKNKIYEKSRVLKDL